MKVDRSKLKKSSSEVPAECKVLIDKLKGLNEEELYKELNEIKVWTYGKCELYHWADVLDVFDSILEKSCTKESEKKWTLHCDLPGSETQKRLLLEILRFTALLIEHSFSRHLYNSMDHLITLITSCDMSTVLYVLNLLYVFSKRSNFISRMNADKKQNLIQRLIHLAESWGGKENGFGLAECCQDLSSGSFPASATTLHFEFYSENKDDKTNKKTQSGSSNVIQSIHMENVDKTGQMPSQIMEEVVEMYEVPQEKQVLLFTHIRLACLFSDYEARVHCVQARLQAISILVYSSAIQDNMNVILYPGLIEELVDIVQIEDPALMDIKSAALRTLTSVIHIERNPRWNSIIDATGASSYHGFLPVLVRTCIQHMIDPDLKPFPQIYATSLFSFLYHLASYENGVEALVSCGMMESLLKVINWYGDGQEHITFVTRAVRVIDLITNMDMAAIQALGGLQAFINRLEHEVNICRQEQPFVIRPGHSGSSAGVESSLDLMPDSPLVTPMEVSVEQPSDQSLSVEAEEDQPAQGEEETATEGAEIEIANRKEEPQASSSMGDKKCGHCFAQRAALLKSMLNFMKRAIPDLAFAESIRHLMDGSLPKSLKHIISNAEYYGPSLFLLATDVVTVYVFQEPSLLSSLQDKGLTDVVLHALLVKDVPATREVLASLPNVFSALCLNARGLAAFVACRPFDRLFKVLLSPDYLPAMRRRRSSDPFGDTASNLGNAMDELMRHQPSLRTDATKAIIKLLEEICAMGQDPQYICQKQQAKTDPATATNTGGLVANGRSPQSNEASSSDEEDEEEVEMSHMHSAARDSGPQTSASEGAKVAAQGGQHEASQNQERQAIPLMDYVLNVMKFVEAILSNNSTDDHCREFVAQNGLKPLMGILGLANLPIDFPSSPACQAVSSVCKSILTLSREPQVLKQGLLQMHEVLQQLQPLHQPLEPPGGSVLLHELAHCAHSGLDATLSPSATPLLHALAAAHAYIMMFVHVCRMGQADIRNISVNNWGSELGLNVLKGLSSLYNSLVWESTVLLALCNENYLSADCPFGRSDLDKLLSKDTKGDLSDSIPATAATSSGGGSGLNRSTGETGSNGVSVAMEMLTTAGEEGMDMEAGGVVSGLDACTPTSSTSLEADLLPAATSATASSEEGDKDSKKKVSPTMQAQLRLLKPLFTLSSRLGRALSELFVLLVKLCVGSPVRQRRSQQPPATPPVPSPAARAVALALTKLLAGGLAFQPPACAPQPKLRMTFLVCSAGFTAPLLFDEKKQPYHLMLQKFVACGGQAALFQAFSWALSIDGKVPLSDGLEHSELPEGTGEFLDSWLALVEKMINPKAVLESPHTLPSKNKAPGLTPFNPVQYLISTQKAAFNAVMNLWNKKPLAVYGSRMSESVLAILCHIIYGEAIIKKQLEKERAMSSGDTAVDLSGQGPSGLATSSAPPPATRRPLEPVVNQQHLQQLMDMGFTREQANVALTNTTSLEQATDYILSNPIAVAPTGPAGLPGDMELDLNDEVQMLRAIAMSLGENAVVSTDPSKPAEDKPEEETEEKQEAEEPLDSAVLDDFTMNIFPGCLKLLDTLPETVYRVCDLLIVVIQRNGDKWQRETLGALCKDLCVLCEEMMEEAQTLNLQAMHSSPKALQLATMLHLLSLLAEEMHLACALAMERSGLPQRLVNLLQVSKDAVLAAASTNTTTTTTSGAAGDKETKQASPKWLAHLLLLLDLWEKVSVALKRKLQSRVVVGAQRIWKWFDDSSGRWCKYSTNNNTTIDEAYKKGESFIRFQAGRRKYSVQFGSMIQLNEETGNRRPVMLSIPTAEERAPQGKGQSSQADEQLAEEIKKEFEAPQSLDDYLPPLSHDNIEIIVRCLSSYLSTPLDPDTLHAAMRLILRVTRHHQYAVRFVTEGGARRLLALTQESNFQGFLNLATLIFRHILEEPVSLRYCMEKVMRNVCAGMGSCQSGVSQGGEGAKEMHYVLRVLGPAACREPNLYMQVARDTLQVALPPASIRDEDEARYLGPNAPQILKCTPTKQLESLVNPSIKTFLWDLLNALIAQTPGRQPKESSRMQPNAPSSMTTTTLTQEVISDAGSTASSAGSTGIGGSGAGGLSADGHFPWVLQCPPTGATVTEQSSQDPIQHECGEKPSTGSLSVDEALCPPSKQQRPLIPKSAILRLLSEIIRSYGNCVQLITQYNYVPGQTELVPEGCSVLAFVLDRLLPQCQEVGDKDCPALSRVFLASIASCSHSPDAQMALVSEVKAALQRALALLESSVKHQRVQALASIIVTMIESCPSQGQLPNQVFKGQQVMNNTMMKILVKKGVLVDLARIPHSLELSSPFLAATVNAALKPLETLSRSVNSPDKFVSMKKGSNSTGGDQGSSAPDQGGTTTQVVTEPPQPGSTEESMADHVSSVPVPVEMNVTIEDVTNDPEAQLHLESTDDQLISEPQGERQEQELNDVLSELLHTRGLDREQDQVISEMTISRAPGAEGGEENEILIDVEVEGDDEDYEPHDSQMVSQVLSEEEDEQEDREQDRDAEDNQDDVSGDEEDYDEADQEEMGEDEDDEEDEDEDEEDEEDGSDMDGEADDFQDIRHPFENDDLVFRMENFNTTVPSLPSAPSTITSTHPLLMRQTELNSARGHRTPRGRLRCLPTVHVNLNSTTRQPNTPIILQRLLGHSTAAEILQLTSRLSSQPSGGPTRVVLSSEELPIIQRPDTDLFEQLFSDPYTDSSSSGSGVLSCIPSTLTRWTEETKVLDGDGVHDLVLILKPSLVEELVKKRDEELAERKEKRKKAVEAEAKKTKETEALKESTSSNSGATTSDTTSAAVQGADGESTNKDVAAPPSTSAATPLASISTAAQQPPRTSTPLFNWSQLPMFSSLIPPEGVLLSDWLASRSGTSSLPTSSSSASQWPAASSGLLATGEQAGGPSPPTCISNSSMISQLLDSFMMDQTPESSTAITTMHPPPLNSGLLPLRLTDSPLQLPSSHNSWHDSPQTSSGPSPATSTPQAWLAGAPPPPMTPSSSGSTALSTALATSAVMSSAPTMGSATGVTSTPPVSSDCSTRAVDLIPFDQLRAMFRSSSTSGSPSQLQGLGQDTLFNLVGFDSGSSSGVTGATPPLSELAFASNTSTAPSQESEPSTAAVTTTTLSTASSRAVGSTTAAGSSNGAASSQTDGTVRDPEVPEGVDPSFLAALPEHIRQEVVSEQLRLQRIQRRAQEQAAAPSSGAGGEGSTGVEVNPEFLAALPPAIQEEVLAQQRSEQARLAAQQENSTNPDIPVDPATFFSSLPSSLRQQVLSDMDDSMLAVLPPELAAEAQELRRDMEERHRRLLQERLFAQAGGASISAILRQSGLAGRLGTRYAIRATQRHHHNQWSSFISGRAQQAASGAGSSATKVKGRFMLEPEALSCLLVLLFVDEPKLNTSRLHRVLRNLCYHGPTRAWLIRALLSILQKAGDSPGLNLASLCQEEPRKDKGKGKKSATGLATSSSSMTTNMSFSSSSPTPSNSMDGPVDSASTPSSNWRGTSAAGSGGYWLSISLDAALGCRANVFQIHRTGGKKVSGGGSPAVVSIHPQAAPVVCRHALDTLISLAKMFPTYFLPAGKATPAKCTATAASSADDGASTREDDTLDPWPAKRGAAATQSSPKMARAADSAGSSRHDSKAADNDFWTILVRLDSASGKSKGKSVQRTHSTVGNRDSDASASDQDPPDYPSSPLGQLMSMLSHPVVRRSQMLTDRLLRLLGLISVSLPDSAKPVATSTPVSIAAEVPGSVSVSSAVTSGPPAVVSASQSPVSQTSTTSSSAVTRVTAATAASNGAAQEPGLTAPGAEGSPAVEVKREEGGAAQQEEEEEENPILYEELKLAVEVLTSKSCSEEGLEDATNLLLQLSLANAATRSAVLDLLLAGARQLGMTVCGHINSLLEQLRELNNQADLMEEESSSGSSREGEAGPSGQTASVKGTLQDRFSNGSGVVVVSAPSKLKTGRELQLPSMSQLTSKTSGQQFFLRILKVIIQLREAARSARTGKTKGVSTSRGLEEAHSFLNHISMRVQPVGGQQAGQAGLSRAGPQGGEAAQQTPQVPQAQHQETLETPMEVDPANPATDGVLVESEPQPGPSSGGAEASSCQATLARLSEQLGLEELWTTLGMCLAELARTPDHHAVLILQPAVEAFFIVHAGEKVKKSVDQPGASGARREDQLAHLNQEMAPPSPSPGPPAGGALDVTMLAARDNSGIAMASITHLPPDTQKFLKFAETHRTVLNQILRQSSFPLAEGPFSVLVDYTRILDFDVKRRYFRQELDRLNEGARREDLPVHVRRSNVFEESFRELFRRTPEEWKQRFYIVFEGEEGQDAGGLLREWYIIISHEIFNQNYALFLTSPGDRVTYSINPSSHCNSNHLSYFKFVGRIIAKAVYDNKLLDCYFTRSFYKHMLGLPVKYMDMESEDYAFYQGLVFLLENSVEDLGYDIFFSTEIQEFGVTETRELIPNGSNVLVTNENKREYVKLVCQMKMTGAIRQQLNAFLEGFYDIIPKPLVGIFTEQELELLISGLPTIDIDDLRTSTEYHKYQANSLQIQWFWRALRSFDQAERANFLQFVTGTSKVPLGGFANLEGMNGTQKFQIHRDDRSTDRLPSAHTCFNQLDLPAYETYDKLRKMLLLAISECSEGFGLA